MIRPARALDADALVLLERAAFGPDAWSLSQVDTELAGATRRVVVAEEDGRVIGYAAIAVAGDIADLTRIVVATENRRSGVASHLLATLHDAARAAGAARILLEVAESNVSALAFYRAHEYTEIARRRAYYANGDDALVMARAVA